MIRGILLVTIREMKERLQSQPFRLFTVIIFGLSAAVIIVVDQGEEIFDQPKVELAVVEDQLPDLEGPLERNAELLDINLEVESFPTSDGAAEAVKDGEVDAALIGDELVFDSEEDSELRAVVTRSLYEARLPSLLEQLGLTVEQATQLLEPEPAEVRLLEPESTPRDDRQFMAFIATFVLYLFLAFYGNWILTGIVEEKASRVVEVLLGLLRPSEMLAGKTLGILIVALIQMAFGIAGAVTGMLITDSSVLPAVTLDVLAAALTLGLMGLVLYSLMFATIGTTVARQSDAQSAAMPVTVLLLAPYLLSVAVVPAQPDSPLSVLLSVIPFTSPLIMPARVALGSPTVIELVAAYVLLVPAIVGVAWVGGRVYAGNILSARNVSLLRALTRALRSARTGEEAR